MNKPTTLSKQASLILVAAALVFLHPYTGRAQSVVSFAGVQTTVPASANGQIYPLGPTGVAVDGAGNVFIADPNNSRVVKVPWTGTSYGAQTTVGIGLSAPTGVAVDGSGRCLHRGWRTMTEVVEVPPGCAFTFCETTVVSGLSSTQGVAVDGTGDVFIADPLDGLVVEVPAGGGGPRPRWAAERGVELPRVWRWMRRAMSSSRIPTTTGWWRFRPGAGRGRHHCGQRTE